MTPEQKRARLAELLAADEILLLPGAFNAASAKLVQQTGFEAVYVSGSATAGAVFGLPDVGLVDLATAVAEGERIASAVDLPTIADADTGFGNVAEAVRLFEAAGISALHIEDQVFPKRCGHLEGKQVIPLGEMVEMISAAVTARVDPGFQLIARCDARSVTSFDDLLDRCLAYQQAGADLLFPEALVSLEEFEATVEAVDVPVLANMTEFGKTPYFTAEQFEQAGVSAVLFPLTAFRAAMGEVERTLIELKAAGGQESIISRMQSRQAFYDLIDYDSYDS
jgi:methylisocitrate lyase